MYPRLLPSLVVLAASVFCASGARADDREVVQREFDRLSALTAHEPATPGAWKPHSGPKAALQLYERLSEMGYAPAGTDDASVAAALRTFQRAHGLAESGVLNAATRAQLVRDRASRLARLRQRLDAEAARPVDWSAERLVVVNVPAYELRAFDLGQVFLQSAVVVGRPKRPTPEMAVNMRAIKYNPTWTPPPTILKEDLIPLLGRDPGAIGRRGLVVLDSRGRQIDPAGLGAMSPRGFHAAGYKLYQPAGERNALGRLKFEITSTDSVYLHDTNHRNDFGKPVRALSSGCVRVQRYLPLAAWLMQRDEAAIEERIRRGRTVVEPAPQIPVYLVYWLADVREGHVVYYPDIYGRLDRAEPPPAAPPRPAEPGVVATQVASTAEPPPAGAVERPAFGGTAVRSALDWSGVPPAAGLPQLH